MIKTSLDALIELGIISECKLTFEEEDTWENEDRWLRFVVCDDYQLYHEHYMPGQPFVPIITLRVFKFNNRRDVVAVFDDRGSEMSRRPRECGLNIGIMKILGQEDIPV